MTQGTETWTMQVPNGPPVTVVMPYGSSDREVRAAMALQMSQAGYKNPNAHAVIRGKERVAPPALPPAETTEAYWKQMLSGQGGISSREGGWREKLEDQIAQLAGLGGFSDHYGQRLGRELNTGLDFIPGVGEAAGAADTAEAAKQGNWLEAAVNAGATAFGSFPVFGDALAGAGKAMFLGMKARNADLETLRRAEEMLGQGADPDTVRRDTGWFHGADGKPRFEISDEHLRLADTERRPDTLGEAIVHPELFENYPNLAHVGFGWEPGRGGYHRRFSEFGPERVALGYDLEEAKIRGVLAHELQHAVQIREGFAPGANPRTTPRLHEGPKVEALDWDIEAASARLRHLQETGRAGSDPAVVELKLQLDNLINDRNSAAAFEGYWRSAGEVEARNTQRRVDLSAPERQRQSPWSTVDVPRWKQLLGR